MSNLNLFQKLNLIQKEVTTVYKNAKIKVSDFNSYSAVNHDDVTALLHLPIANAGIFIKTSVIEKQITSFEFKDKSGYNKINYRADATVELTFINSDNPIEQFAVLSHAYAFDSGDKAVGKAVSMAVKNALLKNFMLESQDNEEERQEYDYYSQSSKPKQEPKQPPTQDRQSEPLASEKQIAALKKMNVAFEGQLTVKQASELIKKHSQR